MISGMSEEASVTDRLVPLRDGRRLGVTGTGDPAVARVVVFCHAAPGASGFDPDPEVTSAWGVHMITADRPGYGSSTALADDVRPSIADRADDLADYLGRVLQQARESGRTPLDKVGVIGWSAGGRIALALAARHPGLVDRVSVVATPAPNSAVRWIPEEFVTALREVQRLPLPEGKARLRSMLEQQAPGGAAPVEALASGEADLAALERTGLRGRLERMLRQAYEQGTIGVADDVLSYAEDDWGFEPRHVQAPVQLVYGAKDPIVTSAHGRWYRRHLPHARLTVVPRAGHLVVASAWERILEHVDPQHGSRSDV